MSNIRQCDICHRKINKVYSIPFRKAKVSTFSIGRGWITDNIDICMDCAREIEQRVKESWYGGDKKIICDRCNKKIEYGFIAKHELQKKKFRLINRSCYLKVDLCKECQAELDNWFEMKKGE